MILRKLLLPTLLIASLTLLAACGTPDAAPDTENPSTGDSLTIGPDAVVSDATASDAEGTEATGSEATGSEAGAMGEATTEPAASVYSGNPEQPFEEGGNIEVPTSMVVEAMDAGTKILFLDARDTLNFEAGHIPGSVNVPFFEAEKHLDKVPNDDTWLITYCACPTAEAKQLADTLMNNGYTKVKVLQEGLDGWTDLGRELDTGAPSS